MPETSLATSPTSTARSAGKQAVVEGLIADLLRGKYRGGDRLTEARAVEQFGISRTPVREALLELEGLGLLELRRNCGAVFHPFGPAELEEIYAVRSLLEVEATRLAAGKIVPTDLHGMIDGFEKIHDTGGIDRDWALDRQLHESIAAAAGNRRLSKEIGRYNSLVQTIRRIVGEQAFGIHRTSAEEHLAILHALREGDPNRAAEAMKRHLAQASSSAGKALQQLS